MQKLTLHHFPKGTLVKIKEESKYLFNTVEGYSENDNIFINGWHHIYVIEHILKGKTPYSPTVEICGYRKSVLPVWVTKAGIKHLDIVRRGLGIGFMDYSYRLDVGPDVSYYTRNYPYLWKTHLGKLTATRYLLDAYVGYANLYEHLLLKTNPSYKLNMHQFTGVTTFKRELLKQTFAKTVVLDNRDTESKFVVVSKKKLDRWFKQNANRFLKPIIKEER